MSRRRELSHNQGSSEKHSASAEARAATRCTATDAAAAKISSRKTPTAVIGAGAEAKEGGDLKAITGRTDPSSHIPISDTGTSQIALRTAYRTTKPFTAPGGTGDSTLALRSPSFAAMVSRPITGDIATVLNKNVTGKGSRSAKPNPVDAAIITAKRKLAGRSVPAADGLTK
jgi:hypothetical protein